MIRLLQQYGESQTEVGENVTVVLLTQDLAMVPMLIALPLFRGEPISGEQRGALRPSVGSRSS